MFLLWFVHVVFSEKLKNLYPKLNVFKKKHNFKLYDIATRKSDYSYSKCSQTSLHNWQA